MIIVIYRESAEWIKLHYDRLQYLYSAICLKSLIYPGVVEDNAYFIYFFSLKNLIQVICLKSLIYPDVVEDNAYFIYFFL